MVFFSYCECVVGRVAVGEMFCAGFACDFWHDLGVLSCLVSLVRFTLECKLFVVYRHLWFICCWRLVLCLLCFCCV